MCNREGDTNSVFRAIGYEELLQRNGKGNAFKVKGQKVVSILKELGIEELEAKCFVI
jgi:hypothetical protein